jgi:hypothetical protein
LVFALVLVSVWIQRSNSAATGQEASARNGNRHLYGSLSEPYGVPIPYLEAVKKIARELRKSQNPTNSAKQNTHLEQVLFLDLPADSPQIHEVHKRVLAEFTDDSPSYNDRYDNEFPLTSNGIHNRNRDRQNENEIHKKIVSILADVTRRDNDRYGSKFPLAHNGIQAETHNRINGRHVGNENEIHKEFLKEDNCMKSSRGDGACGGGGMGGGRGGRRGKGRNRRGGTSRKKITHKGGRNKNKDEVINKKKVLVIDKLNPERLKIIDMPITEDVDDFNLSDEALETLGDKISSPVDITKVKELKGHEAQKRLQDSKKENEEKEENEGQNENILEKNYN